MNEPISKEVNDLLGRQASLADELTKKFVATPGIGMEDGVVIKVLNAACKPILNQDGTFMMEEQQSRNSRKALF